MTKTPNTEQETVETYEAPRVETVLTPESIEREVHYAGGLTKAPKGT